MKRNKQNVFRPLALMTALTTAIVGLLAFPLITDARGNRGVIRNTMPAVAMILAVDVKNGQLVPISSGSGTIIDPNGSVITNHHVLYDAENKRLHDLFIIGLYRAADKEPELICVGEPSKGLLKPELDLALIRCDRDRAGAPWQAKGWPTIPTRTGDLELGEQVWVLGYPGVGGGTIHVTAGLISGWTNDDKDTGTHAFLKTDAEITHGNSGGTAIDEDGNFVGVPTAFRLSTTTQGTAIVTAGRVGLIRPLEHAVDLIAKARAGGPSGKSTLAHTPNPADPPQATLPANVVITSKILNSRDGQPIEGAVVVVFKAGLNKSNIDSDKLEEQALAWGATDADGVFRLEGVPRAQSYTVAVGADGYLPLLEDNVLSVPADAPAEFDPWKNITLAPN